MLLLFIIIKPTSSQTSLKWSIKQFNFLVRSLQMILEKAVQLS